MLKSVRNHLLELQDAVFLGKLEMDKSGDKRFKAPLVTKTSWKKPSNVSSFTLETCRLENIPRWKTIDAISRKFPSKL